MQSSRASTASATEAKDSDNSRSIFGEAAPKSERIGVEALPLFHFNDVSSAPLLLKLASQKKIHFSLSPEPLRVIYPGAGSVNFQLMSSCVFISSFSEVELLAVSQQCLLLLFADIVERFPWGEPILVFQSG